MRSLLMPLSLAAALAASAGLHAVQPPAAKPEVAAIGSLAFVAGAWRSEDGMTEEVWSAPAGNGVIGMFRWLKPDGTPAMLEMLAITREADAVRLRLRHYDAALNAKEEKDKPMTLRLAKVDGPLAEFVAEKDAGDLAGVNYEVKGDELHIGVVFKKPEAGEKPARESLKFALRKR